MSILTVNRTGRRTLTCLKERIGRIEITEADYMELVDRKTASLFSACARIGAMMSGADENTETRLGEKGARGSIARESGPSRSPRKRERSSASSRNHRTSGHCTLSRI